LRKIGYIFPISFLAYLLFLIITNEAPIDKFHRIAIFIHFLNTTIWTVILASALKFYVKYWQMRQRGGAAFIYFILAIAGATLLTNETYMLFNSLYGTGNILAEDGFFSLKAPWLTAKLSITIGGLGIIYLFIQGQIDKMSFQSSTDDLTMLPNRRYLEELFKRELSRTKRHELPMSCAMIDIDFFKDFNDTYGHQTGDYVLRQVAAIMDHGKRAHDVVARYGGEEFIWLLINSEPESSYMACERLRKDIEEEAFEFNDKHLAITISIGLSSFNGEHEATVNSLIYNADRALYSAKNSGRNKSISFEDSELPNESA